MIEVKGVTKKFKNETALDYGDLIFETGKSYMLLGASGCGKSTLLNLIAGILSPDSGSVIIDGKNVSFFSQKEKDKYRIENIGYIFQDFKLITDMTVMDNINILKLEGIDVSGAEELLEKLGMANQKNKKIKHLSGGQKQRVAIVRALVKSPDIILADEPTGSLNFSIGKQVMEELVEASRGKTLIAVSHDDRLSPYFDEVIDMNKVTAGRYDITDERIGDD